MALCINNQISQHAQTLAPELCFVSGLSLQAVHFLLGFLVCALIKRIEGLNVCPAETTQ